MDIIPVEVKSGENIKAGSFKNYLSKYAPAGAVMFSRLEYHKGGGFINLPLYLAGKIKELI
jgi:hypothetical protein